MAEIAICGIAQCLQPSIGWTELIHVGRKRPDNAVIVYICQVHLARLEGERSNNG